MGPHGVPMCSLWVPCDPHGFPWSPHGVPVGPHGPPGVPMDSPYVPMAPHASYGSQGVPKESGPTGPPWVPLGLPYLGAPGASIRPLSDALYFS
jgi:hypothetical protein